MKHILIQQLLATFVVVMISSSVGLADEKQEILKLVERYDQAVKDRDQAFLESIYDADGGFIDEQGRLLDKRGYVEMHVERDKDYEFAKSSEHRIRVVGNSAIETGIWTTGERRASGELKQSTIRYTAMWIKKDGRWVITSEQGQPVDPNPDMPKLEDEVHIVNLGQKWSSAESEVWKVVESYWKASTPDELLSYCHDELMTWHTGNTAPDDRVLFRLSLIEEMSSRKAKVIKISPAGLKIHGDTAIVNYTYSFLYDDPDSKTQLEQGRYTDILKKSEGKWLLIADHGGPSSERN